MRTFLILCSLAIIVSAFSVPAPEQEFYEIRLYRYQNADQEKQIDRFLKDASLPALKRAGIQRVGAFKPVTNDTAAEKKLFVLIPLKSIADGLRAQSRVEKDKVYAEAGKDYLQSLHSNPPYSRMESILLKAFEDMPKHKASGLTNAREERIYELRSYEGHTEAINRNKIEMFNKGGEIKLFDRLGFNAIFYGEVIYGSRMPNLMYMTSFANMDDRNAHWKSFSNDPEWKVLSAKPNYQNNVKKIDIFLMKATEYSDF